MNKIYDNDGSDTGLTWDDAPEWANTLIKSESGGCYNWIPSFKAMGKMQAKSAIGNYTLDFISMPEIGHRWIMVAERPKNLTVEENMNIDFKPVRDVAHLVELMSKGRDVYFNSSKILSVMTRPDGSASHYSFVCYTTAGLHSFDYMASITYKPLKTQRKYRPGDKAEDIIVEAYGTPRKVLSLIDLGADKTKYPLVLTIQDDDGDVWSNTFNYDCVTVEVEE